MGIPEVTKYFVFLGLNIVIAFCGAILLAFGAILQRDELKGVKSFGKLSIGGFSIGIGVLGLCLATWGLWAVFKRKPSVLTYYVIVLLMLFIVQIILGAVALGSLSGAHQSEEDEVRKAVRKLFMRDDSDAHKVIHHIQKNFRCCGSNGPVWWKQMNKRIPVSCCSTQKEPCEDPYEKGCAATYASAINRNMGVIGGVAIGFTPVEVCFFDFSPCRVITFKKMQHV
ncbi:23 kDa integral membrane protein-like [Asbolus verrucosus]|uniref:Tetraspanin n=1 Tax=Asbolus verrucosus TaxID=1661398 RepID=A0A482WDE0_ASBVE|nr:23 kDa integral membrane protein-like [Asbolus verrucosus]